MNAAASTGLDAKTVLTLAIGITGIIAAAISAILVLRFRGEQTAFRKLFDQLEECTSKANRAMLKYGKTGRPDANSEDDCLLLRGQMGRQLRTVFRHADGADWIRLKQEWDRYVIAVGRADSDSDHKVGRATFQAAIEELSDRHGALLSIMDKVASKKLAYRLLGGDYRGN